MARLISRKAETMKRVFAKRARGICAVAVSGALALSAVAADPPDQQTIQRQDKKEEIRRKYPVEFEVNAADAPEMKDWLEKTARVCQQQYPMICEELKSDGFKPPRRVSMTLKKDY